MGIVVLGLGAVLAQSPGLLAVIKWSGIAYLVWIGVAALRSRPEAASVVEDEGGRTGRWRIPRQEFMVAITNPKALLLHLRFADPGQLRRGARCGARSRRSRRNGGSEPARDP
ncbi:LysE family translocator [Streptomyces sp. 2MCAF27]